MTYLTFPKELENKYLLVFDGLFGPFGPNGTFEGNEVEFKPRFEIFGQSRGINRENNVTHDKVEGNFTFNPIFKSESLIAIPSDIYPNQVSVALADSTGKSTVLTAPRGIISDGCTSLIFDSIGKNIAYPTEYEKLPNGNWCINATAGVFGSSPGHVVTWSNTEITGIRPYYGDKYFVDYVVHTYGNADPQTSGWDTAQDWTKPQNFGSIREIGPFRELWSATHDYAIGTMWTDTKPPIMNPSAMIEFVSLLIDQYWPDMFPIKDWNYGDLAMAASEKVNVNQVNMIEFLRDARHPLELIPKLKNLNKLKGIADNYLTVNYGILPTISDLKGIADACLSAKPFMTNGYKTYSAGHIAHLDYGVNHYDLEQHIKLSIGSEDNGLQALLEGLDTIGMLPTCENLWDLIPYSFAIDWFVGVGKFLERVDTRQRLLNLNIAMVTMSRKASATKKLEASVFNPYTGTASWVRYHRWVSDQCPVPPLSLQLNSQGFSHWLESGALILQRSRR